MLLHQELRLGDHSGRAYARARTCELYIEKAMFGYRLKFSFNIIPYPRSNESEEPVFLLGWEVELFYRDGNSSVLMGRMLPDLNERPRKLEGHEFTISRCFDIRTADFIQLIDKSHHGDVTFEFHATPLLHGHLKEGRMETGSLRIPHSAWLDHLNRTGADRFELIAIRVPVATSHLHKPFADAVEKIREAERQYTRGDWSGAAASCRSAWRTILSNAPSGTPAIEHLLSPVIGDPRRKEFAMAIAKGLNDVQNKAVHLEGDVKTGTPPADLHPEDALLCIHWYSALIGYLSTLA